MEVLGQSRVIMKFTFTSPSLEIRAPVLNDRCVAFQVTLRKGKLLVQPPCEFRGLANFWRHNKGLTVILLLQLLNLHGACVLMGNFFRPENYEELNSELSQLVKELREVPMKFQKFYQILKF